MIIIPYLPFLRLPLMALISLERRLKDRREKGRKFATFSKQQRYFLACIFGTIHLLRHQRRGLGRGGDADICKCTQIRNTVFVIV